MVRQTREGTFYGWRVVSAAFVLAAFGLGFGFYGPPVFLQAIHEAKGWPLALISTAVTAHFLISSIVTASLPMLNKRFGIPAVTKAGALALAIGVLGWAAATTPWQLFAATLLSGAGWVTMGVAAVNAIVSPWFVRDRPTALAMAYNGANVGGIIFSPLWATAIGLLGFPIAVVAISLIMILVIWALADLVFSQSPKQMGLAPDGGVGGTPPRLHLFTGRAPLPGSLLWRDPKFLTLQPEWPLGYLRRSASPRTSSRCYRLRWAQHRPAWRWGSSPSWPSPAELCLVGQCLSGPTGG